MRSARRQAGPAPRATPRPIKKKHREIKPGDAPETESANGKTQMRRVVWNAFGETAFCGAARAMSAKMESFRHKGRRFFRSAGCF